MFHIDSKFFWPGIRTWERLYYSAGTNKITALNLVDSSRLELYGLGGLHKRLLAIVNLDGDFIYLF